jgi:hypothetical protein
MTKAERALARIEAITDEIERLQASLGFPCNQASDREARMVASRIERKMARSMKAAE